MDQETFKFKKKSILNPKIIYILGKGISRTMVFFHSNSKRI